MVIGGGYNDIYATATEITNGIADCKTIIASKFPNATMCVGFIGNTTNANLATNITNTRDRWQSGTSSAGAVWLNNLNVLTNSSLFSSDGIHPNSAGQSAITSAVIDAMNNQLL